MLTDEVAAIVHEMVGQPCPGLTSRVHFVEIAPRKVQASQSAGKGLGGGLRFGGLSVCLPVVAEIPNRAISSIGRASRLHREGHRFESCIAQ